MFHHMLQLLVWKEIIVVGMIEVVVGVVYEEVEEVGMLRMGEGFFTMVVGVVEEVTRDRTGEPYRIKETQEVKHLHQE